MWEFNSILCDVVNGVKKDKKIVELWELALGTGVAIARAVSKPGVPKDLQ